MQLHQYVRKYLQQGHGRFVVKFSISAVLGLLFLAVTFILNVPGAHANERATCPAGDRTHIVIWGDTLSKIAERYHTSWPTLASYNRIVNPNLIFVDQTVCIPSRAHVKNVPTQVVQQNNNVIHTAPPQQSSVPVRPALPQQGSVAIHTAPPQQHSVTPYAAQPQQQTYAAPAQPQPTGGSIPAMIDQVFGAYGPAAINIARCESGLNPGAYNPSGASGLFQILPSTWRGTSEAGASPFNAQANIIAAHEIFVRDGYSWREWVCQP